MGNDSLGDEIAVQKVITCDIIAFRFLSGFFMPVCSVLDEHGLILEKVSPEDIVNGVFNFPDKVKVIWKEAFKGCTDLTSVVIPDSVIAIGNAAFSGCTGLTSVDIPDSVIAIGNGAFSGCTGLTSVDIPNSMKEIGIHTFSGCTGLTSVVISDSVMTIWEAAFYAYIGLTSSVVIPDRVTTIKSNAFSNCTSLTSVVIPDSVTKIEDGAFYGCPNLAFIAIDAVGDKYERVKSLLPDDLRSRAILTHEYNQIKAIQDKAYQSSLAEMQPGLPADRADVGDPRAEMQREMNTVPRPNLNEEGWQESYSKRLIDALFNFESGDAPSPSESGAMPEVRETKSQDPVDSGDTKQRSPAVAVYSGGFFSSEDVIYDDSHLETKMPDEPRPAP